MSLDLYMVLPKCHTCGHQSDEVYYNCTYNLSAMWYRVYPEDENFVPIEGLTGRQALIKIVPALTMVEELVELFEALNPENGWGNTEVFANFLRNLVKACLDHPDGVWEADR